jgi:hypothetical protein
MDTLETAQSKIQQWINAAIGTNGGNVSAATKQLFGSQKFRKAFFIVQEAEYCQNVTQDVQRLNLLLRWSNANISTTPPINLINGTYT